MGRLIVWVFKAKKKSKILWTGKEEKAMTALKTQDTCRLWGIYPRHEKGSEGAGENEKRKLLVSGVDREVGDVRHREEYLAPINRTENAALPGSGWVLISPEKKKKRGELILLFSQIGEKTRDGRES